MFRGRVEEDPYFLKSLTARALLSMPARRARKLPRNRVFCYLRLYGAYG